MQKAQALLFAAHQSFLRQRDRQRVMLAVGQPPLQITMQITIEMPCRVGQLQWLGIKAQTERWRLVCENF